MDQTSVNSYSNKGWAKVLLPEIIRHLRQLGLEFDIQKTKPPGQATKSVKIFLVTPGWFLMMVQGA